MRLSSKYLIALFFLYFLAFVVLVWSPSALGMETEDCQGCHGDADMVGEELYIDTERFSGTSHADMGGCPACHATIADTHPDDGLAPEKATCGDCHDDIQSEYAQSMHSMMADCADCHDPHAVLGPTEVSGHDMNRTCADCHASEEMVSTHSRWLPQADLHIESLPCVTCHTGSEDYAITFYFTRTVPGEGDFELADHEMLSGLANGGDIQGLVDTNGDDYISLTELRNFNLNSDYRPLRLQGMMTPERVTHSFQILDNRWDCSFCHASGPEAMQTSYLGFPNPDGTIARVAVEKGAALDTLFGTPDFYMMGATRSKALNYVGLAIIAGGLVMPVGHGFFRFLTRKNRKH